MATIVPRPTVSRRAERRLSVLQLAEVLGNVSEACRRCGIDRKTFYNWRHRFGAEGLPGLEDHSHAPHHHPGTTPAAREAELVALSLVHPGWGCRRLAWALAKRGEPLSAPTVQRLLARHGLGDRTSRMKHAQDCSRSMLGQA